MTQAFFSAEILLYIIPPLAVFVLWRFFYPELIYIKQRWSINMPILLLPLVFTLIDCFSQLIYDFSALPVIVFLICFSLCLHLYDYIKGLRIFKLRDYLAKAGYISFIQASSFLLGLVILRLILIFG